MIVDEVSGCQPVTETVLTRVIRIIFQNRYAGSADSIQMPLTEMPGGEARFSKSLNKCLLFQIKIVAMLKNTGTVVTASGKDARTGW